MREMKDSGIEWIGEIPINWEIMPNKYLMHKVKTICPVYNGEDILSLTMNGIIVRDLDAGGKMPTSFDGYQRVKPGNLLMCLFDIDVTPRCIGLIKQSGLTSPAYSQFVLQENADARYYNYYYIMMDNDKTLLHLAKNLRHSLTEEQLGTVPTLVPPLDEQKKISDFLDRKCDEIDTLTLDIETQIETLEQYKRSVITKAVTKGLDPDVEMKDSGVEWIGEIPVFWQMTKIKYLADIRNESRAFDPETDNYIGLENVQSYDNSIISTNSQYDASFQKVCYEGDVLFGKLRPYLAKVIIAPFDGFCTGEFLQLSYFKGDKRFLRYFMLSDGFIEHVNASTFGTKMPRASTEFIINLMMPNPAITDQESICDFLDRKCAEIDSIIADKRTQLDTLANYKKSLIYEYVTGKKEVPSVNETNG